MPRALPIAPRKRSLWSTRKDEEEDDDDEDYTSKLHTSLAEFQSPRVQMFQILQSTSKKQIDDSTSQLISFYQYAKDASTMERMAMSSTTELTTRDVEALDEETRSSTTATSTTKKQYKSGLISQPVYRGKQEIHLARIIQQGVVLLAQGSHHRRRFRKDTGRQEGRFGGLVRNGARRRVIDYRRRCWSLPTWDWCTLW
jgi:hypothetical protein